MGLLYSHYEANPVTNNSFKINAVSGTLTKTYKDSYFVRFQRGSLMEEFYFREEKPSRTIGSGRDNLWDVNDTENYESYKGRYYKVKEIVVLQVMLCADNNYLVEAIDKENYEKMFESFGDVDE
ncbi:MAG: hypothetical protein IKL65_00185 [Bacilli bacterium]|nr:hypothetical protein [Bacilli bacterium]